MGPSTSLLSSVVVVSVAEGFPSTAFDALVISEVKLVAKLVIELAESPYRFCLALSISELIPPVKSVKVFWSNPLASAPF